MGARRHGVLPTSPPPCRRLSGAEMPLQSAAPTVTHSLRDFTVNWDADRLQLRLHRQERCLWESVPGAPFLACTSGDSDVEESRGFFKTTDRRGPWTTAQHLEAVALDGDAVVLSGLLGDADPVSWTCLLYTSPSPRDS